MWKPAYLSERLPRLGESNLIMTRAMSIVYWRHRTERKYQRFYALSVARQQHRSA